MRILFRLEKVPTKLASGIVWSFERISDCQSRDKPSLEHVCYQQSVVTGLWHSLA